MSLQKRFGGSSFSRTTEWGGRWLPGSDPPLRLRTRLERLRADGVIHELTTLFFRFSRLARLRERVGDSSPDASAFWDCRKWGWEATLMTDPRCERNGGSVWWCWRCVHPRACASVGPQMEEISIQRSCGTPIHTEDTLGC